MVHPVTAFEVPGILVRTPTEEALEEGFETQLSIETVAFHNSEDEVDALLAEVELAFAADETIGGTVRSLEFATYELTVDEDDGVHAGVQTWTAIPTLRRR